MKQLHTTSAYSMLRLALAGLAVGTLLTAVSVAAAQPDARAAMLEALASSDFEVREQATFELLADDTLTPAKVADIYKDAQTPEQRHRLLRVARHHYLRQIAEQVDGFDQNNADLPGAVGVPKDALGADQLPKLNRSAVRVSQTFPGLPAYAMLRRDDLVLAVNGQALPRTKDADLTWSNFHQLIRSHPPGATVKLTLWRQGREVEVALKLASANALSRLYTSEQRFDGGAGVTYLNGEWAAAWQHTQNRLFKDTAQQDAPLVVDWP